MSKEDKHIKFVLTIGDEGAILTCLNGKVLIRRLFITSPTSSEFVSFLASYPDAPLYLLIDVVDQAYIQHTLPPVSALNVSKLVSRKLAKDFDASDIKAAMSMGRKKHGRKEWSYLFVSVRNIPPFSDWIEAVSNLSNYFAGIYLLPVESMHYLRDIKKYITKHKKDKHEKDPGWQIIVSHNRVGGFRQIVFKGGKVIFTRMAQPIGGQTPDVVAGNIEQETLNTIEYIRRLGYEDDEGLDVFVITSLEVKEALESVPQTSKSPTVFTPYDLTQILDLPGIAEERDRFGDVIMAAHFGNVKKHVLPLFTPYTNNVNKLIKLRKLLKIVTALSVVGILCFAGYTYFGTFSVKDDIEKAADNKATLTTRLSIEKSENLGFDADPKLVKEVSAIDKKLSNNFYFPLEFISQITSLNGNNQYVKEFNIQIDEKENEHDLLESTINFIFYTPDQAERMIDNDSFKQSVEALFPSSECGDYCYKLRWDGLLSFKDITLAIGDNDVVGNKRETRVDLSLEGPFKETVMPPPTERRR